MGVYTDILAGAKAWDSGVGDDGLTVATDRVITKHVKRFLARQGDAAYPSGFEADDDVQSVTTYPFTVTSGNFTLTVTLRNEETFTTANISYDASAATIETSINVAATGNITDWTNGDISVALGTDLNAGAMTLTYDGDSVKETNQGTVVMNDGDLISDPAGAVTVVNEGVAPVDEVQQIAVYVEDTTAGNYTLAFNVGAQAFTTASLLYDANAATIETAIDVSATNNTVPSWINGDIAVTGGPLTTTPLVLTFDGNSTAGTDAQEVVIANVDLVGGVPGAESTPTPGIVAVDEIQEVAVFAESTSAGNYTLAFNVGAQAFTTANLVYDDAAATIETAIDVSATNNGVPAWANGDITVSGGPLDAAPLVLTFDGTSTAGTDATEVVIANIDLVGGVPGAESTTTPGVVAVDEVQEIAAFGGAVDGGNYTLTLNLNATLVTTANIAWDDANAAIETAIDTVATGNVGAWTNGDVTVAGGLDMNTAAITFTYDGASVNESDVPEIVINDVDLQNGTIGAESTTTPGIDPVNEIQEIAVYAAGVSGGNYTLTLNLNSTVVTTASIIWNDNAATIETAIDTVATGNVADWVNGDVSVSGGHLGSAKIELTYDGTNYAGADQVQATISDVDLDGGVPGAASTATPGVVAGNEVQGIAVYTEGVSGGNYTLTLNLNSTAVTTANITWNANAGTIESAIDTVATGNVADWVNGDVTVAGGGLDSATVNLTYDGTNYAGADQVQATIADADLDGGVPGASSTLTPGIAAEDEGITVAVFEDTVTSGNYTLQFVMSDLTDMTTANITFDATAANIEDEINTVFTGNYGGWTNGDITVTGGPLDANAVTLAFDGNSVDELNHADPIIASVDLAGHTTTGTESVTTYGQSDRTTMAVLEVMGIIATGGPPPQGTDAGITAGSTRASNPWFPSQETLKALAMQAAIEDGSDDVYVALMTEFDLVHLL